MREQRSTEYADATAARPVRRERGLALVEVSAALMVLALATLGSISMVVSGVNLDVDNRETAAANDVMRRLLEELQDVPFDEVFARFNANADDDPDGIGTALGSTFIIEPDRKEDFLARDVAYSASASQASRSRPLDVRVSFPVDAQGRLAETALDADWSNRAWDLDGDGMVAPGDLSTRYLVLPVRVAVSWNSAGGTRTVEHVRLMTRRFKVGDDQ